MGYCENCGNPLSDDDVFCTECGYRVDENENADVGPSAILPEKEGS